MDNVDNMENPLKDYGMQRAKVDHYIRNLQVTHEYTFSQEAPKYEVRAHGGNYNTNLFQALMSAIHNYETNTAPALESTYVKTCLYYIHLAEGLHAIVTGEDKMFRNKIAEKDKRIAELTENNTALEQSLIDLQKKYDASVDANDNLRDELMDWQSRHKECNDKYDKLVNAFAGRGKIDP